MHCTSRLTGHARRHNGTHCQDNALPPPWRVGVAVYYNRISNTVNLPGRDTEIEPELANATVETTRRQSATVSPYIIWLPYVTTICYVYNWYSLIHTVNYLFWNEVVTVLFFSDSNQTNHYYGQQTAHECAMPSQCHLRYHQKCLCCGYDGQTDTESNTWRPEHHKTSWLWSEEQKTVTSADARKG